MSQVFPISALLDFYLCDHTVVQLLLPDKAGGVFHLELQVPRVDDSLAQPGLLYKYFRSEHWPLNNGDVSPPIF